MEAAWLATIDLLKIKVFWNFWNKGYSVILFVHDVTNKVFSSDPSYIVDFVMCPKLGNSSISITEVIIRTIL